MNEEKQYEDFAKKNEKPNKKNKFSAWKAIAFTAFFVTAVNAFEEVLHDHVEKECLFAKTFANLYLDDEDLSVGIKHQLNQIESESYKNGEPVEARCVKDIGVFSRQEFKELSKEEIKNLQKHGYIVTKRIKINNNIISISPNADIYDIKGYSNSKLEIAYFVKRTKICDYGYIVKPLEDGYPIRILTKYGEFMYYRNGEQRLIYSYEKPIKTDVHTYIDENTLDRVLR